MTSYELTLQFCEWSKVTEELKQSSWSIRHIYTQFVGQQHFNEDDSIVTERLIRLKVSCETIASGSERQYACLEGI